MLPRLQAEEQLAAIEAVALGTGSYDPQHSRPMLERLHLAAAGKNSRRAAVKADRSQLAAIGIGVTMIPAQEARNDV